MPGLFNMPDYSDKASQQLGQLGAMTVGRSPVDGGSAPKEESGGFGGFLGGALGGAGVGAAAAGALGLAAGPAGWLVAGTSLLGGLGGLF